MKIWKHLVMGALLALLAWPAAAQDVLWRSSVIVYGWLPGIDGSFKIGPVEGPVDVPADDVLTNLELAAFGRYRGETERWSVTGDFMFASLGATRDVQLTHTEVDLDMLVVQTNVGYRFRPDLELYFGTRWVKFKTDVDVRGAGGGHRVISGDNSMWDPVVGLRTHQSFGERWRFQAEGDIGGGANMDFTAAGMANVGYQFTPLISGWAGLRAIYTDFDHSGSHNRISAEATFWGPQAGVAFTF
jgi:hypothetical protein